MAGGVFCKKVDLSSTQGALCTVSVFLILHFAYLGGGWGVRTRRTPCLRAWLSYLLHGDVVCSTAAQIGRQLAYIGDSINERHSTQFTHMIRLMNLTPETAYEAFAGIARKYAALCLCPNVGHFAHPSRTSAFLYPNCNCSSDPKS